MCYQILKSEFKIYMGCDLPLKDLQVAVIQKYKKILHYYNPSLEEITEMYLYAEKSFSDKLKASNKRFNENLIEIHNKLYRNEDINSKFFIKNESILDNNKYKENHNILPKNINDDYPFIFGIIEQEENEISKNSSPESFCPSIDFFPKFL